MLQETRLFTPLYGTGPDVTAQVAEWYKIHPVSNMGSFYIGALCDFFFLGIFFHQLWYYYSTYQKDQIWIRRLVAVTTILSLYKTVPSFYLLWDKNILNFGDWMDVVKVTWPLYTGPSASTFMNVTTQTFFAWRCFTLTGRNWYMLIFLGPAMLTILGISGAVCFVYAVDPYNDPLLWRLGIPMIVLGFIIDAVITITVSYKLVQYRGVSNQNTDNLLAQLLSITWEAAAPPALSQAMNVVLFATMSHKNTWHALFNMITPRLYVFSLMYTLNSRVDVRQTASAPTSKEHEQVSLSAFKPRKPGLSSAEITTQDGSPALFKTETHICTLPGERAHNQEVESTHMLADDTPVAGDWCSIAPSSKSLDWESPYRPNRHDMSHSRLSFSL